jgi:FkbM family methyltransferase
MKLLKLAFAALTWPKLSLTSFSMVRGLASQGLLPRTVIDVGANTGQFAVAAAKIFPNVEVHSFEPNPACAHALIRNVRSLPNVKVHQLALGDTAGEVEFHVNSHSHSSSILPLSVNHKEAFPHAREVRTIQVPVSTLDKVFEASTFVRPVLLKLDVQGYEAQVMRGAPELLKRVDFVVLETSFKPMYEGELLFTEIAQLMAEFGFAFSRPVGWLNDPGTGEIIQMDALFERRINSTCCTSSTK